MMQKTSGRQREFKTLFLEGRLLVKQAGQEEIKKGSEIEGLNTKQV